MDYVLVKINKNKGKQGDKMKKIIADKTLYLLPDTIESAVKYSAETLIDDFEWYKLENFSNEKYCLPFLKSNNESIDYSMLDVIDANIINYICSCQNKNNEFYFQKVSKSHLTTKKWIHIGDTFEIQENSKNITINKYPDAIYLKNNDTLYFQKIETITSIFSGIDELYKEASHEETTDFLKKEFITLNNDFNTDKVKKPNRKRIALATEALNNYDVNQKQAILENIKEYCSDLVTSGNTFIVSNDQDLEVLTYGILQRFFTTADGRSKLIANSIRSFKGYSSTPTTSSN